MRILSSLIFMLGATLPLPSAEEKPDTTVSEFKKAPDFVGISSWINTDPLQMESLKGHVVLVDFWDYTCINCIRTLPSLASWYKTYKDAGLLIVGVHTPEFNFERSLENVQRAVKRYGIYYPVALDNEYKTWRAYNNKYWPTSYLIDKEGRIRLIHIGEGNYLELENAIRNLLNLPPLANDNKIVVHPSMTPEIYLGSRRAQNYSPEIHLKPNAVQSYSFKQPLKDDMVGIKGLWRVSPESITSAGSNCHITLNFTAGIVHAVLSGASSDPITIFLDGKPLPQKYYTSDMDSEGQIFMEGERKYDLVDLHGDIKPHQLTINVPPGISIYAFSFGTGTPL